MRPRWIVVPLLLAAATSCGGGGSESDALVVSAAASLTDVIGDLAAAYEGTHPDIAVVVNVGGSSALREQILEGGAIDVFASANTATMDDVVSGRPVASPPVVFARNEMQIAVPLDNPGAVTSLADLEDPDLFVGVCARVVPCGDFARRVFDKAGVVASVDTEEPNVRAVLTKVAERELDAGVVYVTDVVAAPDRVAGIEIPAEHNVVAEYPIVVLADAANKAAADAFVAFVLSADGRAILAARGFLLP